MDIKSVLYFPVTFRVLLRVQIKFSSRLGRFLTLVYHVVDDVARVHVNGYESAQGDTGLLRELSTHQVHDVAELHKQTQQELEN